MKRSKSENDFINHVKKVCKIYKVRCSLKNTTYLKAYNNVKCEGWFEESPDRLVVAMKNKDWLEVLAHEYSHLTQFIEKTEIWRKGNIGCIKMDRWLNGERVPNINKYLDDVRIMELDNEKRTVSVIKSFNLDININNYIKKANSYILFYNWLKTSRTWPDPKNYPYNNANILKYMSNKFDMNYRTLNPVIRKVFKNEGI